MRKMFVKLAESTAGAQTVLTNFSYIIPENAKKVTLLAFSNHYNLEKKEKIHLTSDNRSEVVFFDTVVPNATQAINIKFSNSAQIDFRHFQFARFLKYEIYPSESKLIKGIIEQDGHGSPQPNRKIQVILEIDIEE